MWSDSVQSALTGFSHLTSTATLKPSVVFHRPFTGEEAVRTACIRSHSG